MIKPEPVIVLIARLLIGIVGPFWLWMFFYNLINETYYQALKQFFGYVSPTLLLLPLFLSVLFGYIVLRPLLRLINGKALRTLMIFLYPVVMSLAIGVFTLVSIALSFRDPRFQ